MCPQDCAPVASPRVCLWCGADISGRHWRTKYCNQSCRDRYWYERHHPRPERTCAWCGTDITAKRRHAIYCSRICKARGMTRRYTEDGRRIPRDRARYEREAERRKANARKYIADRPGYAKALQLRRKARLLMVPVYRFSEKDWRRLKARYRDCCAYCGKPSDTLQREHVLPISRGGSHGVGNIVPACARCNYGKRTSLAIEWKVRLRQEGVISSQLLPSSL